jgi:hypothetical protein
MNSILAFLDFCLIILWAMAWFATRAPEMPDDGR